MSSFEEPYKSFPYYDLSLLRLFPTYCPPESYCCGLFLCYPNLTYQSYPFFPDTPLDCNLREVIDMASYHIRQFGYLIDSTRGSIDFYRIEPSGGFLDVPPHMVSSLYGYISCLYVISKDSTISGGSFTFTSVRNKPYWLKYYEGRDYTIEVTPSEGTGLIYKADSFYSMDRIFNLTVGSSYLYMIRCSFPLCSAAPQK